MDSPPLDQDEIVKRYRYNDKDYKTLDEARRALYQNEHILLGNDVSKYITEIQVSTPTVEDKTGSERRKYVRKKLGEFQGDLSDLMEERNTPPDLESDTLGFTLPTKNSNFDLLVMAKMLGKDAEVLDSDKQVRIVSNSDLDTVFGEIYTLQNDTMKTYMDKRRDLEDTIAKWRRALDDEEYYRELVTPVTSEDDSSESDL